MELAECKRTIRLYNPHKYVAIKIETSNLLYNEEQKTCLKKYFYILNKAGYFFVLVFRSASDCGDYELHIRLH